VDALKQMQFDSVLELGCASGPNLLRIEKEFPGTHLSDVDINAQAIDTARTFLPPDADLRVGSLERAGFGDQSTDVLLIDMVLIRPQKHFGYMITGRV
jgi:trans-aconitate methyltransferase